MAVVVDAGPIIRGSNIQQYSLTTTPEILQEIRDKNSRKSLNLYLDNIRILSPNEQSLEYVRGFAQKTGDIASLSQNDIKLLALVSMLNTQLGHILNSQPQQIRSYQNTFSDQWITPQNFHQPQKVSLMTLDFSIQNTAVQMGIKLVSVSGFQIRHVKRWALQCRGCFQITTETKKEFCEYCGNHMMQKISCSVDASGKLQFHVPKKRPGIKGTVFPIPNPKGGKANRDIILREDQLFMMGGRQHKWNWKKPNHYDPDSLEAFNVKSEKRNPYKYGHQRRNPNEVRNKTKKRKN